ncbi:hypothetical protein DRJ17_05660 [Candidatus Woesearchaeota archaeon]|nr:MAG: hypothetical protein DRJ17_05660 [Candidatus Woesearchaeota archaeon]
MKKVLHTQYILGTLLLLLIFSSTVWADIQVSDYEIIPEIARPGVKGTISLSILNSGDYKVSRLTASTQPSSGIEAKSTISIGDIQPSGSTIISIPFTVLETTPSGVYSVRITIRGSYEDPDQDYESKSLYRAIDVPIYVNRPPALSLSTDSQPLIVGEKFSINITVNNDGDKATDVELSSLSDNLILEDSPVYIGDLEDSAEITLTGYTDSAMDTGIITVPILANYYDILGNYYNETIQPSFEFIETTHVLDIDVDPSSFTSGETIEIIFKIKNEGDKTISEIKIPLEENDIFVPLSKNEIVLTAIASGQEKEVPVTLGIKDISPGYYTIEFDLEYTTLSAEKKTDTIRTSINIQPNIDLSVFIESEPSPIVENGKYILSLKVSNIGDSEIKSLRLSLEDTEHISLLNAQNTQFIGSLDSDDFSSVQYDVYINSIENNTFILESLPIQLNFKDDFNNPYIETSNVPIKIYSAEAVSMFQAKETNVFWILLPVIVIIVIIYWYWRKQKHVYR